MGEIQPFLPSWALGFQPGSAPFVLHPAFPRLEMRATGPISPHCETGARGCVGRADGQLRSLQPFQLTPSPKFCGLLPASFYGFRSLPPLLRHICLALKSFSLSLSSLSHALLGPKTWLCISVLHKLRESAEQASRQWTPSNFTL